MTGRDIPDTRAIPSAPPLQIASTPAPIALAEPPKPQAPSAFVTPTLTTQPIPSDKKSTTEVDSLPQVSAAFRRLVADMKITGVFQGIPPRAHINGRLIRAGDTVDKQLNVIFDSIDQEKKTITFRDEAGATVTRRY
jgi:Tfp pilus assembly protein FimV